MLATMALALLLAGGAALAEAFVGDGGGNRLVGTDFVNRSLVMGPDEADVFVNCERSVS